MEDNQILFDLANNAESIDKVLKETIRCLTPYNKDKCFCIKEATGADNKTYPMITVMDVAAPSITYYDVTGKTKSTNVQDAITYLVVNSNSGGDSNKKINIHNNEIAIGDGSGWIREDDYCGLYINNDTIESDDDNIERTCKTIGTKVTERNTSLVFGSFIKDNISINSDELFYLEIGEKSHVSFLNRADVKIGRNVTNSSKRTKVHIFDGADINIDGGQNRTNSPEIFIHGATQIHIDDGADTENKNLYQGVNSVLPDLQGSAIYIHDKSLLSMNKGASITASNNASVFFDAGQFHMQSNSLDYKLSPVFVMQNNAKIIMNGNSSESSPCICMNGNSHILFNSGVDDSKPDPYLIANPDSFIFISQGGKSNSNLSITHPELQPSNPIFTTTNGLDLLSPESLNPENRITRFQMAGETLAVIDAAKGGSTNIRISSRNEGQSNIYILDNTHTEMRQDSIFSLRGNVQTVEKQIQNEDGTFKQVSVTRPWADYPYKTPIDGSMLTMYDNSIFTMHGIWNSSNVYDEDNTLLFSPPAYWKEHPEKKKDSPLVEIIDNAEIRLYGNISIKANTQNDITTITFSGKKNEPVVSFTLEELNQLKSLIS